MIQSQACCVHFHDNAYKCNKLNAVVGKLNL